MKMVIRIAERERDSFRASCPSLPGCVVYGRSHSEAKDKIQEAVCGYIASLDVALPRELSRLAQIECA